MNARSRYVIDTNVFLRSIVRDDMRKAEASDALISTVERAHIDAVTPSVVLAEFVWTLSRYYKVPKRDITATAEQLVKMQGLTIEDSYDPTQALAYFHSYSIKFVDGLIASLSSVQDGSAIIVSYDTDFDTIGITRKEPLEVVEDIKE